MNGGNDGYPVLLSVITSCSADTTPATALISFLSHCLVAFCFVTVALVMFDCCNTAEVMNPRQKDGPRCGAGS